MDLNESQSSDFSNQKSKSEEDANYEMNVESYPEEKHHENDVEPPEDIILENNISNDTLIKNNQEINSEEKYLEESDALPNEIATDNPKVIISPEKCSESSDYQQKEERTIEIISSEGDNDENIKNNPNCSKENEKKNLKEKPTISTKPSNDSSIAAQFNQIVRSRKTTIPRCRRTGLPSKISPRYMTQPVMSENQGSLESLKDSTCADDERNNQIGIQDSVSNPSIDRKVYGQDGFQSNKSPINKYSRTLSGTTKNKNELVDTIDPENLILIKRENNILDQESKSDLSVSPDNNSPTTLDENKLNSAKKSDTTILNSLPSTLRKNIPQHIRIHSDEIKPNADPIADITSDYLIRKISKPEKKELDLTHINTPMSSRISPFRYNFETMPLDSAVLKSPSAQALMRSSFNKKRSVPSYQDKSDPKLSELQDNEDVQSNNMLENFEDKQEDENSLSENDIKQLDKKHKLEKRYLIIQELIYVESEYVKVLEILVNHYMIPLKLEKLIDESHVDSIFNQVTELYNYHSIFLGTLQSLEFEDTVGDKIMQMFSKQQVQDSYTSFIENFSVSEKLLENFVNSKSSIQKFVEQKQKETKNKLPLKALIVQPVQRIPRYELLIKRLIEYTPLDSVDYDFLIEAQFSIHQLAIKINAVKESKQDESINEGLKFLGRLLSPMTLNLNRQFIRHDMVSLEDRKESCVVFIFSDQIILTSVKRRTAASTKKPLVLRFVTPHGIDFIDNVKYKIVCRINIENIEFESNEDADQKIILRNKEMKDRKDLNILEEIEILVSKLDRKHYEMENCIKKIYSSILQEMEDAKNSRYLPMNNNSAASQFLITTKEGIERMELVFSSSEKKHSWERTVNELKNKLVDIPRTPKFNESLSVTRTQSGMQFCCASPIEGYNNSGVRDVWICQTDGFTGHLCLLSMQTEPIVILNSSLPGCNSKVISIIAVPGFTGSTRRSSLGMENRYNVLAQLKKKSKDQLYIPIESKEEEADNDGEISSLKNTIDESSSPSCSESDQEIDEENEENLKNNKLSDPYKATMWIGLEDGSLLIFYSAENVKTTKSKKKIDLSSTILSLLYFDNHIYVSLQNCEIVTFKRHLEGHWDFDYPSITKIGSQSGPLKNLTAVTGYIWGTSNRNIVIINPTSIKIENSFLLSNGTDQRPISLIVCSGQCVWITQENSARVLLYHATSYEYLTEINMRSKILQQLQVWDDIIIRHKEACLRITCLLVCKDVLWIGTSSGLILTILIPNVTTSTNKTNIFQPRIEALDYGHTGPVRFLVGLESSVRSTSQSSRRQSLSPCTTMATQMKVISGGDGFEDFTNKTSKEQNSEIGKDDATSYLLIWDMQ